MTHRARVENLAEKNMSIELIEEVQNGEDSFKVVVKYTETGKNDRIVIEGPSCSDPLEALKKGGEKAGAEMDVEMRNYLDNMDMSGWD
ncbi:uncharacterized protein J4E84_001638 [Alternaria hordeiaustralica]|uniref:uncharacterized protein n=1 Tax=Alternaria hordeiaustralica TaxID=1187925 RepID=UPI0020C3DAC6|nr:uncharacterized protein J4E84_001638 [Alternaria hordeiaustralica]KAI4695014.1 hypothetical protein J4E84_001638 [Alternaria hordeiaustralica]